MIHGSNSDEGSADERELAEEYFHEMQYSPFKRQSSLGDSVSRLLVRSNVPLMIILAGVVVLILLTLFFSHGRRATPSGPDLSGLEARMSQLDSRVSRLEGFMEKAGKAETQGDRQYEQLKDRLDNLEASLSQQMDKQLNRKVDEVLAQKARTVAPRTASQAAARKKASSKTSRKPAATAARYHTVRKGDTLYSISRKHGLTVARLRVLNHLHAGTPILPGQRLLLGR
jgi:LysM repeat protein